MLLRILFSCRVRRRVRTGAAGVDGDIQHLFYALPVILLKAVVKLKLRDLRGHRQTLRLFKHLAKLFSGKINALSISFSIQRNLKAHDINIVLLCQFFRQIAGGVRQNDKLLHSFSSFHAHPFDAANLLDEVIDAITYNLVKIS